MDEYAIIRERARAQADALARNAALNSTGRYRRTISIRADGGAAHRKLAAAG